MSLRIAITGGAGHVGTGVCQAALQEGHTVVGIDIAPKARIEHPNFTYKVVNSADHEPFKQAVTGCDAIIHLAATWTILDADGKVTRYVPEYVSIRNDPR